MALKKLFITKKLMGDLLSFATYKLPHPLEDKIMIIIDMSSYNNIGNINIRRIIDKLIYVSTSSVILTNVFLVLPNVVLNNKLFLKQKKHTI